MSLAYQSARPDYAKLRLPRISKFEDLIFDLCLFFLPLLGSIKFRFMGDVLLSDMFVPVLMVAGLLTRGLPANRLVYIVVAGAALWVFSLVASDIINGTATADYLRGWARNGLGCAYLIAFVCIARPEPRSFGFLVAGLAICLVFAALAATPNPNFEWFVKMGGGSAVLWIICIVAMSQFRKGRPIWPILALFAWSLVALSQNVRSNMTISFVVACLTVASYYGHSYLRRFSLPTLLFGFLIGGALLGSGLAATYGTFAASGALGAGAERKFEFQSRGSNLDQIWNARPELRVALAVIADSPILGHGSWYTDPKIAAAELLFSSYLSGGDTMGGSAAGIIMGNGREARGHSVILQSWVEAGIFGAIFWISVFGMSVTAIIRALQRPNILAPLLFMAAASLCWDILFSPFAGIQRLTNMVELAIIILVTTVSFRQGSAPIKTTAQPTAAMGWDTASVAL